MNSSVEAVGKTIDEAIEKALLELGADRDDVSVEVLEKPKSGFLGIGSAPARVRVSRNVLEPSDIARNFLEGMLLRMGSQAKIEIETPAKDVLDIQFSGEGLGMLIGRRGETLNALQHLTSLVLNKGSEEHIKVRLDTENYRAKREETLNALARKTAGKVLKFRRSFSLEPMNAYERHVIHVSLQDMADIKTYSTGSEPNRKVVVAYAPGGVVASGGDSDRRSYSGSRDGGKRNGASRHRSGRSGSRSENSGRENN